MKLRRASILAVAAVLLVAGCHRRTPSVKVVTPPPVPAARPSGPKAHRHEGERARRMEAPQPSEKPEPPPGGVASPQPGIVSPQLGDALSDEERSQYNQSIEHSLRIAQAALTSFRSRPNDAKQRDALRVEEFIRQARREQAANNLVTAQKLATTAESIARTLGP